LDNKQVQRAGLDYWEKVKLHRHDSWENFLESLPPDARSTSSGQAPLFFFSTKGKKSLWDAKFHDGAYLIFGKETAGFPKKFYEVYKEKLYRIPQDEKDIRSLNLSTAVGIVLYEALRQNHKRSGT
jgi:tRNA (cytidine/uridine-2'-O-)-methyltransferase